MKGSGSSSTTRFQPNHTGKRDIIRLGIFTTHPIQYQAPWFRSLAQVQEIQPVVYYERLLTPDQQGTEFGRSFAWDQPLLDGYAWKTHGGERNSRKSSVSLRLAIRSSEIVLVTGWQSHYLIRATISAFLMRRPVIVRGESNGLKPLTNASKLKYRVYFSLIDEFLEIGKANHRFYLQNYIPKARLHPCRYFVENDRFNRDYEDSLPLRGENRNRFHIPGDSTCFLFAGKFIKKKRPLDILYALTRLIDSFRDIHLLMVGDGPLLANARALADEKDLPVTFTGFLNQSEIGAAYTAADALILPSDYEETWGLVVNEAMIYGNPAVVSDRVGCGPDLVTNNSTGFVFPFGNARELAGAMRTLVKYPAERIRMGRNARNRVLINYSIENAVEGTLAAVSAAIAKGRLNGRKHVVG